MLNVASLFGKLAAAAAHMPAVQSFFAQADQVVRQHVGDGATDLGELALGELVDMGVAALGGTAPAADKPQG